VTSTAASAALTPRLEKQLERQLDLAVRSRAVGTGNRRCRAPEVAAAVERYVSGLCKLRTIEQVERLGPQLQPETLGNVDVLHQRQVRFVVRGPEEVVAASVCLAEPPTAYWSADEWTRFRNYMAAPIPVAPPASQSNNGLIGDNGTDNVEDDNVRAALGWLGHNGPPADEAEPASLDTKMVFIAEAKSWMEATKPNWNTIAIGRRELRGLDRLNAYRRAHVEGWPGTIAPMRKPTLRQASLR